VNTVMNLRVQYNAKNFVLSCHALNITRRILLFGVSGGGEKWPMFLTRLISFITMNEIHRSLM
jgi:hypothetical protein